MRKIAVSDFTLLALCEENLKLTFREKLNIASAVDQCGFDGIELPYIVNLKEDALVLRTVASSLENTLVTVSAKTTGIGDAFEAVKGIEDACIQIVLPISTVQMEYQYHVKGIKMLDIIEKLCAEASSYTKNVQVVLRDATRADEGFAVACAERACEAGAVRVTVVDDAGIAFPDEMARLVKDIKNACGAQVFVQPSDKLNMAAACAVEAIKAGADGVKTAMAGAWLRADVLADIIRERGISMDITASVDVTRIKRTVEAVAAKGEAVMEKSAEALLTEGLDKDATIDDIVKAAQKLGYELSSEDNGKVYEEFKRVSIKRGVISAKELEAIIATSAMQVPSTYHLISYVVNNGNVITATASIILEKNGERLSGVATGDGPIDAAFHAIEQIIGHHYELDDFKVESVTKGREAVGSSLIRLRADGKLYSGNGVSTDIVGACIRAYVNAINKIIYEEN